MISIITPTYNRAKIINATLDSFINQTYTDWECIVVDDHSTDNTEDIIASYISKDSRFRYIKNQRTKGAQGARNTGLLNAKGDWIVFFDSDNFMYPKFLELLYDKVITENTDICTCFTNITDINTNEIIGSSKFICEGNINQKLLAGKCYIDFNSAIIQKNKLIEIDLLDECCPSHQEKDTHIRLSKISRYTTVKEFLVDYYVGASDAISYDKKKEILGLMYVLSKHSWFWRKTSYISFLFSAKGLWQKIKQYPIDFSDKRRLKVKLFMIAPEVIYFVIKMKLKRM